MYVETQTKKLAQIISLFSVSSLCAILLCTVATARHNTLALRTVKLPVYTYQNPFSFAGNSDSSALSGIKAGGVLSKLVSLKWFWGFSSLGALWLASTWYLYDGGAKRKRIHRKIRYTITDTPAKMNPLATIPKPTIRVSKEDTIRPAVLRQTSTRCSFAHRKTTAPCQSRFRPVTLVSSQTRFGRLK
jgi:hypothetical protein